MTTINIILLILSIVLFAFSVAQIENGTTIFNDLFYKIGAIILILCSVFIGLVSKYDEVEAASTARAKKGQDTNETMIGNKKVTL